jgi:hypothetical protein
VAEALFKEWVEKDWDLITHEQLPESIRPHFRSKWRLYCEATILALLLSRMEDDIRYKELVKQYEQLILPREPMPEGIAKAASLDVVIKDITALYERVTDQNREGVPEIAWSRKWFQELGELPSNPITLIEFGHSYIEFFIAVTKSLEELAAKGIIP